MSTDQGKMLCIEFSSPAPIDRILIGKDEYWIMSLVFNENWSFCFFNSAIL